MTKQSKRRKIAEKIQAAIKNLPSADDRKILEQMFFYKPDESSIWGYYIYDKAIEHDADIETAIELFNLLGPTEAFDGFITSLAEAKSSFRQ